MGRSTRKSSMAVTHAVPVSEEHFRPRHYRSATTDSSIGAISSDDYFGSHTASTFSQSSDCDYALSSGETRRRSPSGQETTNDRSAKPRWIKNVKNWLSVSEPSAQALKNQRTSTYQRYGIGSKDPQAAAKMHLPIGKVPNGVTTSTTGPTPEKAMRERARQAADKQRFAKHGGSQSMSSGMSSNSSIREAKKIAPWVE
ncbi:hypothetical protein QQS21_003989 [Conoideocrella luteorostrata]|uniref:Uncharacterized protein n=1 Tax=Conoideocrella luteorostrata TaxID=1105319 RepID=A0AAJ0FVX8_9HYPO|nr:hypothetical protein QQS21_003989 [Conoideocrella luteorostrata]